MPRRGLWTPLGIIIAGFALTLTVLARTEGQAPTSRSQSYTVPTADTGGYTSPANATAAPTATAAPSPSLTTTPTTATAAPTTAAPTLPPTQTAVIEAPTFTPTATSTPGAASCVPGEQITVSGRGPPRAPILLYFGQRIVGGGSVAPDGTFSLPLAVGMERAGDHVISVRVRGGGQVLVEFVCNVPAVTPTPLPGRRPLP